MIKAAYKTKQQELILSYLKTTKGNHFTAEDVRNHFEKKDVSIGLATIYRQLEKFVADGILQKYVIDEKSACCFEYIGENADCAENRHFHLKCQNCGKLIHLECEELLEIKNHLEKSHGFLLNPLRTVIYGTCMDCRKAETAF